MAWKIELVDDCAVVLMNTNKVKYRTTGFLLTSTMRLTGWSAISIRTRLS